MSYTMSTKYPGYEAKTGIFWDLKDFPIHREVDPDLIYKNIISALEKKGYRGHVSIRLYGDKNTLPPNENELIKKYDRAEIRFILVPEVEGVTYACARDNKMLVDVLLWRLENCESSNLMLLANLKEEMALNYIYIIHWNGHNIFFVDQPSDWETTESPAWLLENFSDGGNPNFLSGSSQHVDKKQKRADEG